MVFALERKTGQEESNASKARENDKEFKNPGY